MKLRPATTTSLGLARQDILQSADFGAIYRVFDCASRSISSSGQSSIPLELAHARIPLLCSRRGCVHPARSTEIVQRGEQVITAGRTSLWAGSHSRNRHARTELPGGESRARWRDEMAVRLTDRHSKWYDSGWRSLHCDFHLPSRAYAVLDCHSDYITTDPNPHQTRMAPPARIFLIGTNGFVGSRTLRQLLPLPNISRPRGCPLVIQDRSRRKGPLRLHEPVVCHRPGYHGSRYLPRHSERDQEGGAKWEGGGCDMFVAAINQFTRGKVYTEAD